MICIFKLLQMKDPVGMGSEPLGPKLNIDFNVYSTNDELGCNRYLF